jgi:hypothetical protein
MLGAVKDLLPGASDSSNFQPGHGQPLTDALASQVKKNSLKGQDPVRR